MAHKETRRQNTINEIKGYAHQQMKTGGPSGISLSAIARSMEISAPALYRYYSSREDLIKVLIDDACVDLVQALQISTNTQHSGDFARRLWAVISEYRDWALAHPVDFQLIFTGAGKGAQFFEQGVHPRCQPILDIFLKINGEAYQNGQLRPLPEDEKQLAEFVLMSMQTMRDQTEPVPVPVFYTSLVMLSRIHGLVVLELSQGFFGLKNSLSVIFQHEAVNLLNLVGLNLSQVSPAQKLPRPERGLPRGKSRSADDLHVIFGSGPLGQALMRELLVRGKKVRIINRSGNAEVPEGVELLGGDAFQTEFTRKVCQNAAVVYQCAQPTNGLWLERFAALNAAILDGAAAKGAKFIYPDNMWVYGSVDSPIHEGMANKPITKKGQIRARVCDAVLTAHRSGRVRASIGRAADIFGPQVLNAVWGERIIVPLLSGKTVTLLGDLEAPHTFTYIEDFGKGLAELGESDEASGQVWHIPNSTALSQLQFSKLFFKEAGLPPKIHGTSRQMLILTSLLSHHAREELKILYQFERPFTVDSSKFEKTFQMDATPLPEAVRRTVTWYRKNFDIPSGER